MHLALTAEETRLLLHHLAQQIEHMDTELLHTDKRELQRSLAHDLQDLRTLTARIRAGAASDGGDPLPDVV